MVRGLIGGQVRPKGRAGSIPAISADKPKNLIFLDIDGVLATRKTHYKFFEKACVENLKTIIGDADAFIIISSTWRYNWSLEDLKSIFNEDGIEKDRIIGVTPDIRRLGVTRGAEISEGFRKNKDVWVRRYNVIDDDSDLDGHLKRHVHVKTAKGLSNEDAKKAIKLLCPDSSTERTRDF